MPPDRLSTPTARHFVFVDYRTFAKRNTSSLFAALPCSVFCPSVPFPRSCKQSPQIIQRCPHLKVLEHSPAEEQVRFELVVAPPIDPAPLEEVVGRLEEQDRDAGHHPPENLEVDPAPPVEGIVLLPRLQIGDLVGVDALIEGEQDLDSVPPGDAGAGEASDDIAQSTDLEESTSFGSFSLALTFEYFHHVFSSPLPPFAGV
jgi:hypothetical protein